MRHAEALPNPEKKKKGFPRDSGKTGVQPVNHIVCGMSPNSN